MIKLTINKEGKLDAMQQSVPPIVYLDHWALCDFSENQALTARLTEALKSRDGTLALSWLNLVEFTKITKGKQARKAENLIEGILPRIFFLEVQPFRVIEREDVLLAGGPPTSPHADLDFFRVFTGLKPKSVNPFTAHNLFRVAQTSKLAKRFNDLADTIIDRVETMRDGIDTNPEFQSAIRRLPPGFQIQRGTRFILRELIRTLLIDRETKITRNQAIDLLHAIVPVAYCDFVLLDKHWQTQVDRVRSRLNAAGIFIPIGKVFSAKAKGVDQFLCDLESS